MSKSVVPILAGLALAVALLTTAAPPPAASQSVPPETQSSDPFRISVNLDLVTLPVTIKTAAGTFASGLKQDDFEVYEDGVRQSIRLFLHEDLPITAGLVIDHSGSMHLKLADVLEAARTFVRLSNRDDQMFVINFNEHVSLGLPDSVPFSDRVDQLGEAILQIPAAGQTALYDAVSLALDRLRLGQRDKRVLIVVSDGGDNASRLHLPEVLRKAEQSGATIYAVGIFDESDPDQNPDVLRRLARVTGGEAFFPAKYSETVAICERIAADIRSQYTIGYVSGNVKPAAGFRAIRVLAHSGKTRLVVRTKPGYIAGAQSPGGEGAK